MTTRYPVTPAWGGGSTLGTSWPATSKTGGSTFPKVSAYPTLGSGSGGVSSSFPSFGSGISASGSFPTLGGSKSVSSGGLAMPSGSGASPKMSTTQWAAALSQPTAKASGGGSVQGAYGQLIMPAGFSAGALGPSASSSASAQRTTQPTSSAAFAAGGTAPSAPASRLSPSGQAAADAKTANARQVTQGGVTYTALGNTNTQARDTPLPLRSGSSGAVADPSTRKAVDQYGREFYYAENPSSASAGQPIAGLSANNTVLKTVTLQDGTKVTYDTGATAFTSAPATPARQPQAAPPVAVGRPTQAHQPVSVPVVTTTQPAPPPRTQDDIDAENQGRWLG